jgi:hypothetical protein
VLTIDEWAVQAIFWISGLCPLRHGVWRLMHRLAITWTCASIWTISSNSTQCQAPAILTAPACTRGAGGCDGLLRSFAMV